MCKNFVSVACCLLLLSLSTCLSDSSLAVAQEPIADGPATDAVRSEVENASDITGEVDEATPAVDGIEPSVKDVLSGTQEKVNSIAKQVDDDERAKEAKSSILKPIYQLSERLSFPAFHWLAFMFMVTGCVSFALQLVLGKLIALTKFGFSLTEILSDALGLVISVIGLVLTTQAATENSTFTESAFSVLSATVLGFVLGCVFYIWGQRQELQAIDARRSRTETKK